jgi:arsenite-transporting ATPase
MTTMPLPADGVLGAVDRLYHSLEGVRAALTDGERTSVRLVTTPERMVIAESRRSYTALNLFGYHVDAVIVNRLLPDAITDPWFGRWKELQAEHVATIEQAFAGVPLLRAPLFDEEVTGHCALERLGDAVYASHPPHALLRRTEPMTLDRTDAGWMLRLALPFAERGSVDAFRRGDELYVKLGGYTRSLLLPAALQRCEVTGAGLTAGALEVRFAERRPDGDV